MGQLPLSQNLRFRANDAIYMNLSEQTLSTVYRVNKTIMRWKISQLRRQLHLIELQQSGLFEMLSHWWENLRRIFQQLPSDGDST